MSEFLQKNFPTNHRGGYSKNHWTNTRLVCTHFNAFFILNPNMVLQGCQLVRIFRISYGKSVQIRKYDLCHSEYGLRKKKKKKKRLQKEIMTGADKLIGGNSNITLYYFHGRANVVNLMWLAYVKSIRILLSRWPIKMYFTELLDRCKADIWRHAGCNFCKQEWYYLLRYGTGVIIMASKPTKTVRHQKFLTEYTAKWDFIVPSVKGETYARCNSCNSDFSIKSSGAYDCWV